MLGSHFLRLVAVVMLPLAVNLVSCSSPAYENLCNAIVSRAQAAAGAFNSGDSNKANSLVAEVRAAYDRASAMFPEEAQAHLNMAVFLSNIHAYDEAIELFELSKKLVGSNRDAQSQIAFSLRRTKYQKFSMLRDEAYRQGQGNMTQAHHWALEQVRVSFEPHKTNHDLGTIEVMLCEYNATYCATAEARFRGSAFASHGHYMQSRLPTQGKLRMACLHSKLITGNFSVAENLAFATVSQMEGVPGVMRTEIHDQVTIHGVDGVLTFENASHCHLAVTSADFYTNIPRNMPIKSPNGPPVKPELQPSVRIQQERTRVLLLTQFSGTAFYHWMCEVLPRLVVAQQEVVDGRTLPYDAIVIPGGPAKSSPQVSFIRDTFAELFPELRPLVVSHIDVTKVESKSSTVITWGPQPCPSAAMPHCASLAAPAALQSTRDSLRERLSLLPSSRPLPYLLIATRGSGTTMRQFDESALLNAVRHGLESAGAALDIVVFNPEGKTLRENLKLFSEAAAVVGVHGGSLANIVVCAAGTPVVEIGFSTSGAQQYAHLAKALRLGYTQVRVLEDSLRRAIGAPEVRFNADEVADAVRLMLHRQDSTLSDEL